ncbi:helix-turn-helix domain-containing protein [Bacillus wiedmannii]|uniref:helix-turn-helix domain-containing protein n=1 Tax=Bacillus wiedmannii TaxID=1890302 RepID=UPI000BF19840|nr:transcriptional regulator [Bacillus wiedmannii]
MELANISQQQLAKLLNVSQATISAWSSGLYNMPSYHVDKLTEIVGEQNIFLIQMHSGSTQAISEDLQKRMKGRV